MLGKKALNVNQSSSSSNVKLEKKIDDLVGRLFSLENKENEADESDGSVNINEILQQRIHQLEMTIQKQDKQIKKLNLAVNKLLKNQ